MSILCYVSEQVKSDATKHSVSKDKVVAFAKDVEERQSLARFDHFPPPCLTKKKIFGYSFRLIAVEKRVGDHLVIIFLRIVPRGGEYGAFLDAPPFYAGKYYDAELDDAKLEGWVNQRIADEAPPPARELSDEENTFLWASPYGGPSDDLIVCETHAWVQAVRESRIADRLIFLPDMILKVDKHPARQVVAIRSPADAKFEILACHLPQSRQCVLLSASYGETEAQREAERRAWEEKLAGADSETVLRHCCRSYPILVCCDNDMWLTV